MKTKLNVFIGDYAGVKPEDMEKQPPRSFIFSASEQFNSWTKVGTADVEVEFSNGETMAAEKLASLKSQLKEERADAQMRVNAIEDKIAQLLAITNEVSA